MIRTQFTRPLAVAAALTISTFTVVACGSVEDDNTPATDSTDSTGAESADTESTDTAATEAAAGDESLNVLCTADETLCAAWIDAFQEETGIDTTYVRMSSGESVARLQASADNPEFDVWHAGPVDGFVAAREEGLLDTYESDVRDDLPADVKDDEGYWSGVYLGALGFCSNQSRLDELGVDVPTSWNDLTAPELQGELMMAHPSTSGTAFTALWTQVERLGGQDEALDYMRDFNDNVLQYTRSGSAPAQSAGRGEVAVSLVFSHDCVSHQEEGFDDLVVSFPEEGTGYEIGGVALLNDAQNTEAAQQYIDWALTPAAQELGPENNAYQIPTHPDAELDDRMVSLDEVELVDYDFVEAGENRTELTARFDSEIAEEPAEDEE